MTASGQSNFDVFISYATRDNSSGWVDELVSRLRKAWLTDVGTSRPLSVFFDKQAIESMDQWEHRLGQGLRSSRVLLVCATTNYYRSDYCRKEWVEFHRHNARRLASSDAVAGLATYKPNTTVTEDTSEIRAWRHEVDATQIEDLSPYVHDGSIDVADPAVSRHIESMLRRIIAHVSRIRSAAAAPHNFALASSTFVGRSKDRKELRNNLSSTGSIGTVTVLHAIGGMGKSDLATTYATEHAHFYRGGMWRVPCEQHKDILGALSELARSEDILGLVDADHSDAQALGRRVVTKLEALTADVNDQSAAHCLLILDNVTSAKLLGINSIDHLPEVEWLHVVATTRLGAEDVGPVSRLTWQQIEPLEDGDAMAIFEQYQRAATAFRSSGPAFSPEQHHVIERIITLLGGYTLAVELAAAYLASNKVQPEQLLAALEGDGGTTNLNRVSKSRFADAIRHQDKMVTTILDQTMDTLSPRAQSALTYASLLPPETISWQWLEELTAAVGDEGPSDSGHPAMPGLDGDWSDDRSILEGRALLSPADTEGNARLHRVLGEHLATLVTDEHRRELQYLLKQVVISTERSIADPLALRTLVLALTRAVSKVPDLITSIYRIAPTARNYVDSGSIAALVAKTVVVAREEAETHPDDSGRQRLLALTHLLSAQVSDDPESIDTRLCESSSIIQELLESEPSNSVWRSDEARILDLMGSRLLNRKDLTGALSKYEAAQQIRRELMQAEPGNQDWERLYANSLARVGATLRKFTDEHQQHRALATLHEAVKIRQKLLDADADNRMYKRELAIDLTHLATAESRVDRSVALEHSRQALEIRRQLSSSDIHNMQLQYELATSHVNVASLVERESSATVLSELEQALAIRYKLAKADENNVSWKRDLARALTRLGQLCFTLNRDTDVNRDIDAHAHFASAVSAWRAVVAINPTHRDRYELAVSLSNLADVRESDDDPNEHDLARESRAIYAEASTLLGELLDDSSGIDDNTAIKCRRLLAHIEVAVTPGSS